VAARRLLWLAAVALLPVPYWAIEVERAPVVRLLLLAAMTGAAWVAEPGGVLSIVAGALVVQSMLWLGVLWLAARLVVRWVPAGHRGAAVAAFIAALVAVSLLPVHHTPFARSGPRGGLRGLLR
jgi:hypothetical protein